MNGVDRATRRSIFVPFAALMAIAILVSPIRPFPLLALPFAMLMLAFRTRELVALAIALGLAYLALTGEPEASAAGWSLERGWCLLVGGLFVGFSAVGRPTGLLDRGLATVTLALGAIIGASALRPGLGATVDEWMESRIREAAAAAYEVLVTTPEAASGSLGESVGAAIESWAGFQHDVYPALLAIATISALSTAWYVTGRRDKRADRPPPVREFRFRDEYVWILVFGLLLLVLPLGSTAFRVGENATLFMGLLYLARGAAILAWIGAAAAASAWTWLLLGVGAVLAYPLVFGAALVLGVGDTWLHVRERLAARSARG